VIEVGRRSHSGGDLISKEFLEPLRRQRGVARGVLNVAMPEVSLDRARVRGRRWQAYSRQACRSMCA
jgi:hypothetical protein